MVVVENVAPKLLRSASDLNGRSTVRGIRLYRVEPALP